MVCVTVQKTCERLIRAGASLAGGRGAITGTFVGTLLMVVIKNAGKAFQINDYILDVITGALIIFAVAMDMVKSRKKA